MIKIENKAHQLKCGIKVTNILRKDASAGEIKKYPGAMVEERYPAIFWSPAEESSGLVKMKIRRKNAVRTDEI